MCKPDDITLQLQLRLTKAATVPAKKAAIADWLDWAVQTNPDCRMTWQMLYQGVLSQLEIGRQPIVINIENLNMPDQSITIKDSNNLANIGSGSTFAGTYARQTAALNNSSNLSPELVDAIRGSLDEIEKSGLQPDEKLDAVEQLGKLREALDLAKPDAGTVKKYWDRVWGTVKGVAVVGGFLLKLAQLLGYGAAGVAGAAVAAGS